MYCIELLPCDPADAGGRCVSVFTFEFEFERVFVYAFAPRSSQRLKRLGGRSATEAYGARRREPTVHPSTSAFASGSYVVWKAGGGEPASVS